MLTKTIFVNGCFDILHRGHVELLSYAKSLGDKLIVAIDSDERVSKMKGPSRPINKQQDRVFFLKAIRYVDDVKIFQSDIDLENIIKTIKPYIMIIGNDWQNKKVIGSQYAQNLIFFKKIDYYSTTKILEKLK